MRFWDTSAIVLLIADQPGSEVADAWLGEDRDLAVWTLAQVEGVSAVRRLLRDGALAEDEARAAEDRLADILRSAHVVVDVERAKASAVRLLRVHALRAADALQLAAALLWADGSPDDLVLHTLDRRLALAAGREGLRAITGGTQAV